MKNKNGYTIIELMIVIVVVGVFAFVAINKASYAFSDNEVALKELEEQKASVIESAAKRYGEEHLDIFKGSDTTFIRVSDLVDNGYLLSDSEGNVSGDSSIKKTAKIELILKDDKVSAHLEV